MNDYFENFEKFEKMAKKSEEWSMRHKTFSIVVKHWVREGIPGYEHIQPDENIWNIYAHIFNNHPEFEKFNAIVNVWDCELNMHGGVNHMKRNLDDSGKVVSVTFGNDFNHIYDDENRESEIRCVPNVVENALSLYERLSGE